MGICFIFSVLGGLVAFLASSSVFATEDDYTTETWPYITGQTFADRVNSLLNAKTLIPNHPENDAASQNGKEQHDAEIISKLQKFLQDGKTLNETYSNYLAQFCRGREVLDKMSSSHHDRRAIFKDNVLKVAKHNVLAREGKMQYEKGINKFSDMTKEEILEFYTGAIINPPKNGSKIMSNSEMPENFDELDLQLQSEKDQWIEFNWASHGYVTPVKDQGRCGSCTLFAIAAAAESSYLLKYGQELDLSEQELLDCTKGMVGYGGCAGNSPAPALLYMKAYGLTLEEDYEYVGEVRDTCSVAGLDRMARVQYGGELMLSESEDYLKNVVRQLGPIAIFMSVQPDIFDYHRGVYESESCLPEAEEFNLNHMALLVGYGTTSNGVDYWIVKNSWSEYWGNEGYIRMRRNFGNMCGIATYPIYVGVA